MKHFTQLAKLGSNYETPLAMMTLGQLLEAINLSLPSAPKQEEKSYIHGLRGIQQLFGVSHKTAQFWKNTWLAPACSQLGKTILIDRDMAIKLFEERGREDIRFYRNHKLFESLKNEPE